MFDALHTVLAVSLILQIILCFSYIFKYKTARTKLETLENKFRTNPSYETQLFMADMLRSGALFHIERLPPEDVLIRRG